MAARLKAASLQRKVMDSPVLRNLVSVHREGINAAIQQRHDEGKNRATYTVPLPLAVELNEEISVTVLVSELCSQLDEDGFSVAWDQVHAKRSNEMSLIFRVEWNGLNVNPDDIRKRKEYMHSFWLRAGQGK